MAARESTVTYRTAWGNVKWDGRGRRQFSTGKNSPDHGPSHTSMWDFLDPVECFEIVYNNIHIAGNILIMVRTKKFPTPGQSIPPLPPLKIQRRKSEKKVHQPPALPPAIEPGFWKTYHNCCEKFCQALYVRLNLSTEGGVPKVTFCSNIVSSVIICSIIGFLLFVLTWVGPATPGSDGGGDDDHNGGNGGEGAVPFSKSMEAFQAWAKKPFPEPSRVVKKGGGGGQGTWGKLLDTDGESHIDRDDPNCDCGEVFSNRIIPTWHHVKAPAGGKAPTAGIAVRHVRRTHSGKLVRVKKEGGGGKGTWGKLLDTDGETHIDRNDPNYDSGEEPYQLVEATVADPLDEYKKTVASIIEEYFTTDDVGQAASDLRELSSIQYHPYFIKRLVSMAMDRHDKEKEMASVLLSALYADVISPAQIQDGFYILLDSADDLAVDILDAVDILALFLARAVVDDILPPAFLTRAKKALPESSKGVLVIQTAEKSYLSAPHHAELVERRWGGSTHITVEEVKKKISGLLREYVESEDTLEACRCIRELGVSFYHHEVVKRALILGMETRTAEPLITKLLKEAAEEGIISSSQMAKGFSRLAESLDDLALDIPSAKTLFQSLVPKAISEGWLDDSFVESHGEDGEVQNGDEKMGHYKKEIVSIIHEYFLSDDIPELIQSLEDLAVPEYNPIFLKKLITLAMDRKNREKEMASVLLSALHIEIFSTEDIVNGFVLLLESAEDTALDILDASNELALFLARAVIDDVLAPLNLEEIGSRLPPNCSATETVQMARSLVSARHAGERLLRCWGGGTGWAVEDAKDKITKLLEEYESGRVVAEACQCIRDIGMPFFNHEVVKKALVMAMEKKNDSMLDLLQECFGEGLITINQMTKGFTRIKDGLDDLALDIPNAREKFSFYVEHAQEKGWLLPTFGSSVADGSH